MSIYSGFPTRALETAYNKTVYNMMFLLQNHIHRNLTNSIFFWLILTKLYTVKLDETLFTKHLTKLYKHLLSLERNKHLMPKYSFAVKDLADFYKISSEIDSIDTVSVSSNTTFSNFAKVFGGGTGSPSFHAGNTPIINPNDSNFVSDDEKTKTQIIPTNSTPHKIIGRPNELSNQTKLKRVRLGRMIPLPKIEDEPIYEAPISRVFFAGLKHKKRSGTQKSRRGQRAQSSCKERGDRLEGIYKNSVFRLMHHKKLDATAKGILVIKS